MFIIHCALCCMMSTEYIFEVRHIENHANIFAVNLKDHQCSCRRWQLIDLPCNHAMSILKSRNISVDDYIPEFCKKSRYQVVYSPFIYPVNRINLWVRTKYLDVQPLKYIKMLRRPKKRRNLEQGDIDATNHKMRKTRMVLRYRRCKKIGKTNSTCKMTPSTQASQQASQGTQARTTQASQQASQGTRVTTTQASQQAF